MTFIPTKKTDDNESEVRDLEGNDLLEQMLTELKILNAYMAIITGDKLTENDLK